MSDKECLDIPVSPTPNTLNCAEYRVHRMKYRLENRQKFSLTWCLQASSI